MLRAREARTLEFMRRDRILSMMKSVFGQLFGMDSSKIDISLSLLELGADSLFLLQASRAIQDKFGVKIPFRMMLDEVSTIDALTTYIDQNLPPEVAAKDADGEAPAPDTLLQQTDEPGNEALLEQSALKQSAALSVDALESATPKEEHRISSDSPLERLLAQQLQLMSEQLDLLRHRQLNGKKQPLPQPTRSMPTVQNLQSTEGANVFTNFPQAAAERTDSIQTETPAVKPTAQRQDNQEPFVPYQPITKGTKGGLSTSQQEHLNNLIAAYSERTKGSKQFAQDYRPVLANSRATAGFRLLWKEMQYPIIMRRGVGSRLWDVDGNEYVDVTMGFGALLFGHSPSFILEALQEQTKQGIQLGGESLLSGKAAELLCELTGVERATFCNSGTEAVMTALRLARTVTGRTKIAMFQGSYHGTFDGVMVKGEKTADGKLRAVPLAPGIPEHLVDNLILLSYDDPDTLNIVKAHAHELAAVLVEPLQSRRPDMKPEAFLQELRRVTQEAGAALIFDEVISGFRFHPGGAQALLGVRADLVTYGKAVGGGVPVAVISGKAAYMDAVDGGGWNYGDSSYPQADTTYFAGTYFMHPLIMPAVLASLTHLKKEGPQLQENLNRLTSRLTDTLNDSFEQERAPIRMARFGSLFRFNFSHEEKYRDLFYYTLLKNGVYICETRTCFLSTAHTDEDVDFVVQAVKKAMTEMRAGGFLSQSSKTLTCLGGSSSNSETCSQTQPPPDSSTANPKSIDEKARAVQTLPLTDGQKELWILAQMGEDASRAYNVNFTLRLRGSLDLSAMRKAVRGVIDRHDALRISFSLEGDYQQVHDSLEVDVPLVDFSHIDSHDRERKARESIAQQAQETFDLTHGPLVRAQIARLEEQHHLLILTIHHLVTDGWSNSILLREIVSLYTAECEAAPRRLPDPMQFSEYVQLQSRHQEGSKSASDEEYWQNQFSDSAPILELPYDRSRPPLQTYSGGQERIEIEPSLCSGLKSMSARHGCTLFMAMLAGFKLLLHRLSGQDDIVVGISSAGQSLLDNQYLVGYCVNLLPLRSRVAGSLKFKDYLASVKSVLLSGYEHQNHPFGKVVRKLNLPRDPSRSPLVTVIFNLDQAGPFTVSQSESRQKFSGLAIDVEIGPSISTKFEIDWNITESAGGGLILDCTYNTDLFDAQTIRRWMQHFETLLKAIAANPEQRLSELPILTEVERQWLVDWNTTGADYPKNSCIHQLFESQAARAPEAVAAVFKYEQLSYGELNAKANQLAHYLQGLGVGPDARVGICVERSLEMVIGILAVLKAGGAYVPLDPQYPNERLEFMLEDAQVQALLTQGQFIDRFRDQRLRVVRLDEDWQEIDRESRENLSTAPAAENLAYVIYTSGSTGKPKGVMITHRGLVNYLSWCTKAYKVEEGRGAVVHSSIGFDLTVTSLFPPLLAGKSIVLMGEGEGVEELSRVMLSDDPFSLLKITPVHLELLSQHLNEQEAGSLANALIIGGEMLLGESLRFWRAHAPRTRLINEYGPTETVVGCCVYEVDKDISGGVPIGRPIANTQLYLLDKHMNQVPGGVIGELYIGGAGLARGYLNRPELTAERFIPDPFAQGPGSRLYKTGDVGRYLPDGHMDFLGRNDHQVKVRGHRIELGEVESVLREYEGVTEGVVTVRESEIGEKLLAAYIVAPQEQACSVSDLQRFMREKLPEYMVPSAFMIIDALPLTHNGKVDMKALPPLVGSRREPEREYVAPLTPAEKLLANIWAQVLRLDRVGIHDNFFGLGGDSIRALQIISRAKKAGLRLTSKQIFQSPTIAELAATAEAGGAVRPAQEVVTGPAPLTPIQHRFFELNLPDPHHWNMSMLLDVCQPLSSCQLEKAVRKLFLQHDVLRSRFIQEGSGWRQFIAEPDRVVSIAMEDLSHLPAADQKPAFDSKAAQLQAGIDLSSGPLMRVALFDMGPHSPNRLLIVMHHLVVDIASQRILLEDLQRSCEQATRGDTIELPPRTSSFKKWAERLKEFAQSESLQREAAYWLGNLQADISALPVDHPDGANIEVSAGTVTVALEVEETHALLQDVPRKYRAQIHEVLLTALAEAVAGWTGKRALQIDIEGHGREPIFDDVDLSRTAGWFTAVYPVLLDLNGAYEPEEIVSSVKQQLRGVPNGGIGYGLLRYLTGDKVLADQMRALPQSEASFNYLGQINRRAFGKSLFKPSQESLGSGRAQRGNRPYRLEFNAGVISEQLHLFCNYSENVHHRSTIESLAKNFLEALRWIITSCQSSEVEGHVPLDFSQLDLDKNKFNELLEKVEFEE